MRVKNTASRAPHCRARRRVRALPLEGVGVVDPAQRAVVDRAHADAVGLDVVGQAVHVAVGVAGGAGELALEGDVRAVEEPLAPADAA